VLPEPVFLLTLSLQRAGTLADNVRSLQRELESVKASREQEGQRNDGRRKEEQTELTMWKDRCREMENQLAQHKEQLRVSGSQRNQAEVSSLRRGLSGRSQSFIFDVYRMTTQFGICETN
jgi:chromosome segregation ATPase